MIHLIVGNTGAGKTTYANNLQKSKGGIVFSLDTWSKTLFYPDQPDPINFEWIMERIERSESMIFKLVLQLEEQGVDSILDLGLSKISHRKKILDFAHDNGVEANIHFLDISKGVRRKRIDNRNVEQGETFEFEVSDSDFEFMETWFEPLTPQELKMAVVVKS